jgi:hypothetical protein
VKTPETTVNGKTAEVQAIPTFLGKEIVDGNPCLCITKDPEIVAVDEPTFGRIAGVEFENGVVEVKVLSRLLLEAPDYARGFIGVTFRINDDNKTIVDPMAALVAWGESDRIVESFSSDQPSGPC